MNKNNTPTPTELLAEVYAHVKNLPVCPFCQVVGQHRLGCLSAGLESFIQESRKNDVLEKVLKYVKSNKEFYRKEHDIRRTYVLNGDNVAFHREYRDLYLRLFEEYRDIEKFIDGLQNGRNGE